MPESNDLHFLRAQCVLPGLIHKLLFDEIEQLALKSKLGNCNHIGKKGCAVIEAIITGIITEEKLKNYRKIQKELKYPEEKQDKNAYLKRKEKEKNS